MNKVENIIKLVETSIEKALRKQSTIETWIHGIKSFSTPEIRCLLNNLANHADTYLEVGTYQGGTLCSAMCGNKNLKAYAVDNFSEFKEDLSSEYILKENLKKIEHISGKIKLLNKDSFLVDKNDVEDLVDVYLYDGAHDEMSQEKALTHYLPFMSDIFILLIDDYNGESVINGTERGLELIKDQICIEKKWIFNTSANMQPIWWNGLYIAVISKKNKK
jgi:hypothetical protein